MATLKQPRGRILTVEDVRYLRYPIPESWKKAAGLLKSRKNLTNPLKYQRHVRKEWEGRLKRQVGFAAAKHP
jgi:hypothetical protein